MSCWEFGLVHDSIADSTSSMTRIRDPRPSARVRTRVQIRASNANLIWISTSKSKRDRRARGSRAPLSVPDCPAQKEVRSPRTRAPSGRATLGPNSSPMTARFGAHQELEFRHGTAMSHSITSPSLDPIPGSSSSTSDHSGSSSIWMRTSPCFSPKWITSFSCK